MTRHHYSYSYFMFFTNMIMGIIISLSSTNWFTAWFGMELNIYSFIPMILTTNMFLEKEAAMKYMFSQAIPSSMFLLLSISTGYSYTISNSILFAALTMKLGMAPAHFWLSSVMSSIPWNMCWLLATIQKLTPFMLMFNTMSPTNALSTFTICTSAIVGGLGGLNQTHLRPLMAYSSIGHMAWITAAALYSSMVATLYMAAYIIIASSMFFMFSTLKFNAVNTLTSFNTKPPMLWLMSYTMMSLGGLPPTFGFFPKLMVILTLANNFNILLTLILMIGTLMNLFYYFKIILSFILQQPLQIINTPTNSYMTSTTLAMMTIMSILSATMIIPLILF